MKKKITHIIGIDEAGRGPLAGPVAIGVACVPCDFDWNLIQGVGDSKKVTAKNREAIFCRAQELKKQKLLNFSVTLIDAQTIDTIGISKAVQKGISIGLNKLHVDTETTDIRLDGLLKAPKKYPYQTTIIQGDAKEKIIGLASILAKVTRDALMMRVAGDHPHYHFNIHKGYGTKKHRDAILQHGLSILHRRSFCKKYL